MTTTTYVTIESADHDYDHETTIDTDMYQVDRRHRSHVERRLRECFEELWGHEVIITFHDEHATA